MKYLFLLLIPTGILLADGKSMPPLPADHTINYSQVGTDYPSIYRLENDEVLCYYVGDSVQCKFKDKH